MFVCVCFVAPVFTLISMRLVYSSSAVLSLQLNSGHAVRERYNRHACKGKHKLLRTIGQLYVHTPTSISKHNRIMIDGQRIDCECQKGRQ